MSVVQIPFEVRPGNPDSATSTIVVVKVKITDKVTPAEVLGYLRSGTFKKDFVEGFVDKEMPGHGMELRGGPRPVHERDGQRDSPVVSYEQDVRLTKGL